MIKLMTSRTHNELVVNIHRQQDRVHRRQEGKEGRKQAILVVSQIEE